MERAVQSYAETLFQGCSAALSTLLNRAITITPQLPLLAPGQSLAAALPTPWFVAQTRFSRGLAGGHDFVLSQNDAVELARLMLGEDVSEPAVVTSDHEDALREMVNQMVSLASSSLKTFFAKPVVLSFGDLHRVEQTENWSRPESIIVLGTIAIDGVAHATLALTVPPTVTEEATAAQAGPAESAAPVAEPPAGLDLILDIAMAVTVELGRTRMLIKDILALGPGSVIELDKLAGEPVDLLVNERPIAKGEVVVIDDNFGIRLTQIAQTTDRLRSLSS
jgi:flagellar motor switch protein FliN/FliY